MATHRIRPPHDFDVRALANEALDHLAHGDKVLWLYGDRQRGRARRAAGLVEHQHPGVLNATVRDEDGRNRMFLWPANVDVDRDPDRGIWWFPGT